ncbi:NAD(P)H-dependent oxidoreductase [Brucepastera parasyntrophica]|uniref:NAD(P)H-dependent oxidoreductase n=1 Tax=Brucepastera parasyntrophica TaxID=2880008 RepID=UPI00210EA1AB|nr:NAD(P)H-dependent oxidoreductase [Brucepastera parasyntrophica]ULQ59254.1 NAD(P)H-dependent oxidoreductase [Brucepastera parasyntrophica]
MILALWGKSMNILVINGHPDRESFVSALFKKYADGIDKKKHAVELLDLSSMKFDPVLRFGYRKRMEPDEEIEHSQKLIQWADHFVFFFPIWFGMIPSLLKGWFERTLTPGIAYNMKGYKVIKHLKGKTAHLVFTCQSPVIYQRITGNLELKMVKRLLWFSGIKTVKVDRLGNTVGKYAKPERRSKFLKRIGERAAEI